MRYWIIPVLVCAGAAQAHAGSFIGANINNPIVSVKAGAALGQTNSDTTTQNSFINAYAVGSVAAGSNPSNNTTVSQKGAVNAAASQSIALGNGKPGSHLSNTTTVKQTGPIDYANVGQDIQSLSVMPMGTP